MNKPIYKRMSDGIVHDIKVLGNRYDLKIQNKYFIGKGSYGKVYYIGNMRLDGFATRPSADEGANGSRSCVIKITPSCDPKTNEYYNDFYFYKKYDSKPKIYKSLPLLIEMGKTYDAVSRAMVDYMIMEYVGIKNLYEIFRTRTIKPEEKILFKMIYVCIHKHISAFHNMNFIYRDVSPANVVLSDKVTSFLMENNNALFNGLNTNMRDVVFRETTLKDIAEDYVNGSYGNIVRFVDAGLFGDLEHIYKADQYNKLDMLFFGNFPEFQNYDCMFICTLQYISPFHMFNLSSMIQKYDDPELSSISKNTVSHILKLSDIWSICIMFLIHLHDTNTHGPTYQSIVNSNISRPFVVEDNKIKLNINLSAILNKDLYHEDYSVLQDNIVTVLGEILSLANGILSKSTKDGHVYKLVYNEEIINELSKSSIEKLLIIKDTIDEFDKQLIESLLYFRIL